MGRRVVFAVPSRSQANQRKSTETPVLPDAPVHRLRLARRQSDGAEGRCEADRDGSLQRPYRPRIFRRDPGCIGLRVGMPPPSSKQKKQRCQPGCWSCRTTVPAMSTGNASSDDQSWRNLGRVCGQDAVSIPAANGRLRQAAVRGVSPARISLRMVFLTIESARPAPPAAGVDPARPKDPGTHAPCRFRAM